MAKEPEKLTISPEDIVINERGELTVANAALSEKLKGAAKDIGKLSAADNYVGCGGNAYQCGGKSSFEDFVNEARNIKVR
jgi:hypothetical protein